MDIFSFIGRFHPIFVHLPIGFLVLAILLEWLGNKKSKTNNQLIPLAWLLGGISAFAAALCGWFLGETGSYSEDNLFVHRWLGVALVIVSFIGWYIKYRPEKYPRIAQNGINILILLMLTVEGHKGGNLTHGEDYLVEYAPKSIQNLIGLKENQNKLPQFQNPDSTLVYNDLIYPILDQKCVACHNSEVKRGGLSFVSIEEFQEGGENGPVLKPKQVADSELFKRITLPQTSAKFMPPKSNPLTYDEIKLVEWWINEGCDFEKPVSGLEASPDIQQLLLKNYGLDTKPKPWYETVNIAPLDSTVLSTLQSQGFRVKTLSNSNYLLDIDYRNKQITKEQLLALEPAANHITWLSLAETNIEDDWLQIISQFPNLTRLELENSTITDDALAYLSKLKHLEALNLYGTKITDAALEDIKKINGLKRVYLWGTNINPDKAKALQESTKGLQIIIGNNS